MTSILKNKNKETNDLKIEAGKENFGFKKNGKIKLSDHFTFRRLLAFTLPSIAMQVLTALYTIVDGVFVSNFAGTTPFAGLNFIFPFLVILSTFGYMFGTGGSALVAKFLGEGRQEKARSLFSLFVYTAFALGVVLCVAGYFLVPSVAKMLGAEGEMLRYSILYARIVIIALPAWSLQQLFQMFFIAAEKPKLGFVMAVIAGLLNVGLDALFIIVFDWGLAGAAIATAIAQGVGGFFPVVYFFVKRDGILYLGKTKVDFLAIGKAASNGISEFASTISISVLSMLYNMQLLKYAGETGVAAYGIIMYIDMVFFACFVGYSQGMSPIVSFNYGAQNHKELHNILKKSIAILASFAIVMFALAEILAGPLASIFASKDAELLAMTVRAFRIYSISFLVCSGTIYGSAFFTALNNGVVSAAISFVRVIVFEIAAVLILPAVFGINGIWWAVVIARTMGSLFAAILIIKFKGKYHYWDKQYDA